MRSDDFNTVYALLSQALCPVNLGTLKMLDPRTAANDLRDPKSSIGACILEERNLALLILCGKH
jgi:hypothetical protein